MKLILAAIALGAALLNFYGAMGALENRSLATQRVSELRSTAERQQDKADQLKQTDPALSDLYQRHANTLKRAADDIEGNADNVLEGQKRSLDGELPEFIPDRDYLSEEVLMVLEKLIGTNVPISDVPFILGQLKEKENGNKDYWEKELAKALGSKMLKERQIYKDIALARLQTIYQALGPNSCYRWDGKPTDDEAWAVATNRLRNLYSGSQLTKRAEFREAIEQVTGVPFDKAIVSLPACRKPVVAKKIKPKPKAKKKPVPAIPTGTKPWIYRGTGKFVFTIGSAVCANNAAPLELILYPSGKAEFKRRGWRIPNGTGGCQEGGELPAWFGRFNKTSIISIFTADTGKLAITAKFDAQTLSGSGRNAFDDIVHEYSSFTLKRVN